MKQKELLRTFLSVITFLLIVTGIIGTIYFYNQALSQKQAKDNCQAQLANLEENQDSTETNQIQLDNCQTLTQAEQELIADWIEFEKDQPSYSLKHPQDWQLTDDINITNLEFTNQDGQFGLQIRTGEMTEIGFPEYEAESRENIDISCQDTVKTVLKSDESQMTSYGFKHNETEYLILYSYTSDNNIEEIDQVIETILKTFTLN